MIPLPNREKFIKLLKGGMDIRNACKEASITRSNLYKYFKEFPAFKDEADKYIEHAKLNAQTAKKLQEEANLMKIKKMILNRKR